MKNSQSYRRIFSQKLSKLNDAFLQKFCQLVNQRAGEKYLKNSVPIYAVFLPSDIYSYIKVFVYSYMN